MRQNALLFVAILGICMCNACGGGAAGIGNNGGGGGGSQSAATHFSVTAAATSTTGAPINFTVNALDAANSVHTTYSGTVHFTSTDPQAVLPANSTLTNGTGTFSATLNTSGMQTISATDTAAPSITGISNSIQVSSPSLAISSGAPPNGTVGVNYGFRRGPTCTEGSPNCLCIIITGLGPECRITLRGFPFSATNGTSPYNWSWAPATGSSSPPGLEIGSVPVLDGNGSCCLSAIGIEGNPTAAGTYDVIVTVTDSGVPPANASKSYTIQIDEPSAVTAVPDNSADATNEHHHYQLVDLGSTFGGSQSYFVPGSGGDFAGSSVLSSEGTAVGFADTAAPDPFPNDCFWDCDVVHTFISDGTGVMTDLGAIPGGGSSVPMWITSNGLIAGVSENGQTDPLIAGLPEMRAVLWKEKKIIDLGTLPEGGYQSEANSVNSSGQVVGAALNTVPDANSMDQTLTPIGPGPFWLWGGFPPPYLYEMRAFLWDERDGMQDLGTLPGGTDAQATMINDAGQVIGFSYTASTQPGACFPVAVDSFIWEKGKGMTDLGGLGGTCTLAAAINQRGQIVGSSNGTGDATTSGFLWERGVMHELEGSLGGDFTGAFALNERGESVGFGYLPGDAFFHAALWRNVKSLTDLGTIGNDVCSYAGAINDREQIVGSSLATCDSDSGAVRAILWQDGSLFDLNTLIPSDSTLSLQSANAINDRGEIAGIGVDSSGNEHAFLLLPCDENHPGVAGCDYSSVDAENTVEIQPSQFVQVPAAAPGRNTLSTAQMMTRFRLLMAARHLRNGMPQNQSISLSTFAPAATTATLKPGSMYFSCVDRLVGGGCTPPQKATLTNSGATTLTVHRISVTGSYFSQTNNCPGTLKPHQSCAITLSFDGPARRDQKEEKFTGSLAVSDSAMPSPQSVTLTRTTSGVP